MRHQVSSSVRHPFAPPFQGSDITMASFPHSRDQRQGQKFNREILATDKVVIVTGANVGIGLETARDLAKRGAHVYMACRDMKKCEKTREDIVVESRNRYVYCRQCDLSSMQSIREFVKR